MTIPAEIQGALFGFMASQVLFTGDETGLFDLLAREPQGAAAAACQLGLDADATARFLAAAASLGLCSKNVHGQFAVSGELRPYLARDGGHYFGAWIGHLRAITTRSFAHLPEALRSGRPQLGRVLGDGGAATFEALYADAARVGAFADSMWNLGFDAARELAEVAPLGQARHLVDLGGGSGSFAVAAALAHPTLAATVLDLPPLAAHCERRARQLGVAARVAFRAGDFFRDALPAAEAYALGYILSDWSTEAGTQLLKKAFDALPAGGVVLVLERLFDDDGAGPTSAALMDLCMLVETEGRHRSAGAYVEWLGRVGFVDCSVRRSSADKHMICGIKPAAAAGRGP